MEEFDELVSFVEQIFNDTHELMGLVVVFPQTNNIIVNPLYSEDGREEFEDLLRSYCLENNIDRFYIASEAWAIEPDGDTFIRPSEHPKREEILIVTLVSKDGNVVSYAPIIGYEKPARFIGNWKEKCTCSISRWDGCLVSDKEKQE